MDIETKLECIDEINQSLLKLQSKINNFNNKINTLKDETNDKDVKDLINLFTKLSKNIDGVLSLNSEKLNLIYMDLTY